ncbi:MAG: insulinase family protein [Deltaproteobacteria bacterium]|nr:insulinase family protein [Deltaproteobacteria bacterium]
MIAERDIFLIEEHTRPIITLTLTLRTGMLHDPPGREGLSWLTSQMLLRGAGKLGHSEIMDTLDHMGASLGVSVGRDTTTISGDTLTRKLGEYEELVGLILAEPTFPEAELDKLKRQTLAELQQLRDHDSALAQRAFVRRLFDGHPYGRPLRGSEETIAAITRDDVVAFWREHYRPDGAVVGAASDIDRARLDRYIERTLGRLPRARTADVLEVPPWTGAEGVRVVLVDKPERTQTQVTLGHATIDANHEDHLALYVGNVIFGGTFTARLSHEIREKRGWSYGAYSYLQADARLGTFMMRFYPGVKDTVPALRVADDLLTALVRDGVDPDEMDATQNFLAHSHLMSFETAEKELSERLSARLIGRPDDWLDRFVPMIRGVTREQVDSALRRHLTPDTMVVSVVCTASDLREQVGTWPRVRSVDVLDYREA